VPKKPSYPEEFLPGADSVKKFKEVSKNGPISLCFFNNKGGVGKTTLVANLAAELALNYKAKVLVVDADPQCNLTQYVISDDEFFDYYHNEDSDYGTVFSVIHPLSIGKGYTRKLPIIKTKNFGFDVIVGDPRLALKEDLLAQDWRDAKAGGTRGLRTTLVFSHVLEMTSGYDFVFFDMGPSLGAINRSILLAVDGFVVPMSVDIFSSWALKNIGTAVRLWKKEFEVGVSMAEDPDEIPRSHRKADIRFIGYVTQQHKEKKESDGSRRIVEAYNTINETLPEKVHQYLKGLYNPKTVDLHLGEIKHLASLAPKSQSLHSPMINVKATGSYTTMRKQARLIFSGISARLIDNLHKTFY